VTTDEFWEEPLYAMDGRLVGAELGDWMTVTTEYNSLVVSRTYRAIPDPATLEQRVNLVFPEGGGTPPTASVQAPEIEIGDVRLTGTGIDNDENGQSVLGYEWTSDLNGVIGTEAIVTVPLAMLSAELHTLELRVQDDEGQWSAPVPQSLDLSALLPVQLAPAPNTHQAQATTPTTIQYNQPLNPATVNAQTVVVHGTATGQQAGNYSVSDNQFTVSSQSPFHANEIVQVILTDEILSANGHTQPEPRVYQYRVGAEGGTGYFTLGGTLPITRTRYGEIGDVNGDGYLDAVFSGFPNVTSVWFGQGNGQFVQSDQTMVGKAFSLGDLNGDGRLDIYFAGEVALPDEVWFNNGNGYFTDSGQRLDTGDSVAVALGDLDGDGDLDAFACNWNNDPHQIWLNDGTGIFSDSGQTLEAQNTVDVALGDLDGDGDLDAVTANWNFLGNRVWMNDGNANFTETQMLGNSDSQRVALGDLDGDGDLDLFVANQRGRPDQVYFNDGQGIFTDSGQLLGDADGEGLDLGDLDGDGDLDAFVANEDDVSDPADQVWMNDGFGFFTDATEQRLGQANGVVAYLGDFDEDGDLDALVGNSEPVGGVGQPSEIWLNDNPVYALTLQKSAPVTALAGDPITFTLTLTNTGNATLHNLHVTDLLPVDASYVSGGSLGEDGVVSWQFASLASRTSLTAHLIVTATSAITNTQYAVTSDEISVTGEEPVTVDVGERPMIHAISVEPEIPIMGELVVFSATVTSPAPYTTTWVFNDTALYGDQIARGFQQPGPQPYTLRVQNRYGMVAQAGELQVGSPPPSTWLVLLYLAGDNNLDIWMHHALQALTASNLPANDVRVIALIDGHTHVDTALYEVRTDALIPLYPEQAWYHEEVNSGDPNTLIGFTQWARQLYPTQYTYMVIADHGAGLRGISWDLNDNHDYLTPDDLTVFANSLTTPLDVLHLDACLMSMAELAHLFEAKAETLVASQNLAWGIFAYDDYLTGILSRTPTQQAIHIADRYAAHLPIYPYTIAALDLARTDDLTAALANLTQALLADDYHAEITTALAQVQRFDSRDYYQINADDEFIDLYHFVSLLNPLIDNPAVNQPAQAIMALLTAGQPGSLVLSEHHRSGAYGLYWDLDNAHGLSVYYPATLDSPYYADYYYLYPYTLPWVSGWRALLAEYGGIPGVPVQPGDGEAAPTLLVEYKQFLPLVINQE
jgi:uncharacterized repeat protein (TIGR01451 family)